MRPKYKVGMALKTETTGGEVVGIMLSKEGVEYKLDNDEFVQESQVTKAWREVTQRQPRQVKRRSSARKVAQTEQAEVRQ